MNMLKNKYSKSQWINLGRWIQPPLSGAFWSHWHEAQNNNSILPRFVCAPVIFLDGHTLIDALQQERLRELLNKFFDENKLGSFHEKFEEVSLSCEKRHRKLLMDSKLSLRDYMAELFDSYLEMIAPWTLAIILAKELEDIIYEKKIVSSDEEILAHMRPYHKLTDLERQSLEIKKMKQSIVSCFPGKKLEDITLELVRENKNIDENLKRHVEEFSWFGTHHWDGDGYTIEKCFDDIHSIFKAEDVVKKEESVADNSGGEDVWKLLASFVYWRTHSAETTAAVVYHSRSRLEEVASLWNMSYYDLTYLSSKEILEGLDTGNFIKPENFEERKKAYGCVVEDGVEHIFTGSELSELMEILIDTPDADISELRGSVASKGEPVRGIARVVFGPQDFSKFSEGDILVASETTPDFVPLMKKAKAIVTETGGVTSHAAIVSRELGVPCVVNTKISTQVLHDGDLVEVDAYKGVVRIIKKAK